MSGAVFLTIAYVLLAVFLVGFLVRTVRLARMPVHLRWELAPIPHEKGKGHYGGSYLEELDWWTKPRETSLVAEARYMLLEIVFLKAVWEHNRGLWWFSFPFHFGLYLLAGTGALLLVATVGDLAGVAAASGPVVRGAVGVAAAAGCGLGALGVLGLLWKRLFDPRLRDFTSPVSQFNLVLLLVLFATGLAALGTADYVGGVAAVLGALGTANAAITAPPVVMAHVGVVLLFLAYLPFTKMMHFMAKYFTYHEVRWNDEPMVRGSRMERDVEALLAQSPTWAGPHVRADGVKTWVDIATEEIRP
jgi:nitrate reductase gamma subunit